LKQNLFRYDYKRDVFSIFLFFIELVLFITLTALEIFSYFIISPEYTIVGGTSEFAYFIETFIILGISLWVMIFGLLLIYQLSGFQKTAKVVTFLLIILSGVKIVFYLPALTFDVPVWYIIRQFVPIVLSGVVLVFSILHYLDIRVQKYL
jgi:hypothetical protein